MYIDIMIMEYYITLNLTLFIYFVIHIYLSLCV